MSDFEEELVNFMYWLSYHDISMFDDIEATVSKYLYELYGKQK